MATFVTQQRVYKAHHCEAQRNAHIYCLKFMQRMSSLVTLGLLQRR